MLLRARVVACGSGRENNDGSTASGATTAWSPNWSAFHLVGATTTAARFAQL